MLYSRRLAFYRVQQAKKLLRSTDLRVYEIADRCGYAHCPRFNEVFKRLERVSPSTYRRSLMLTSLNCVPLTTDIDSASLPNPHGGTILVAKRNHGVAIMPSLTIKNIPDELLNRLRLVAKREHRSLNKQVISCLERSFDPVTSDADQREEVARRIRERTSHVSMPAKDILQIIERGRR